MARPVRLEGWIALCAVGAVHGLVVLVMSRTLLGDNRFPFAQPQPRIIALDLVRSSPAVAARAPVRSGEPFAPTAPTEHEGLRRGGETPLISPSGPDEPTQTIDPRWRVAPAHGRGWANCPDDLTHPRAQAQCNENERLRLAHASSSQPPESSAHVAPLQSALPADHPFARTAAANEAWRRYKRDEGPYPGLRSLFKDQ